MRELTNDERIYTFVKFLEGKVQGALAAYKKRDLAESWGNHKSVHRVDNIWRGLFVEIELEKF